MKMWTRHAALAATVGLSGALAASAFAAPPANDLCSTPQAITGSGPFNWDLTEATTGPEAVYVPGCDTPGQTIRNDVWFCWTSTCNGLVEFSTCGQTQVDTLIRIYQGCNCPLDPVQPLCCSDNDCGKQTKVVCDAVCGQTYLIQLGASAGGVPGPGTLTITCLEQTCDGGTGEPPSCECCGARPPLVDSLSTPFNTGLVAAVTNFQWNPTDPAVYLIDLGNQGAAPLGTNWNTQRYSAPDWTMGKLGSVFGVTLDDVGNVYVGHTSVFWLNTLTDPLGSLGGAGSVYALNGNTGAAAELIRLPNSLDPTLVANNPNEAYPGLGNLTFDCGTGRLYVANLEDGRIYSIDPNGGATKVKSTYDIATGTITGPLPNNGLAEPGDAPGWVPLGERPYAVKVNGGRLYYSVWAAYLYSAGSNTIRSVALNGSGDFVPASDQLEITVPPFPGYAGSGPVVDITFDDQCCLYAAERDLDELHSGAHAARVLQFCHDAAGAGWGAPFTYQIGHTCTGNNSAGGVGFEVGASKVWAMGDALNFCAFSGQYVYGLQGQPVAGAPWSSSILVDVDGALSGTQKFELGSLEVTCLAPPCAEIDSHEILCGPDNTYTWTFTFTNNSNSTASVLILPDPSMSPNVIPLNPPIPSGSTSQPITVTITGQQPGSQFCFDFILGDIKGQECCHLEPCIDLPDCDCAQFSNVQVVPTSAPGVFQLTFTLTNLATWNTGHVVFIPTGGSASFSPQLLNVGPIAPYGSQNIGPVTISTSVAPGSQLCFTIGNHSPNWLECCFKELCVTVPPPNGSSNPADLDHDGDVDAGDLAILLGGWGTTGPGDLNGDGVVDATDLAILLGSWG